MKTLIIGTPRKISAAELEEFTSPLIALVPRSESSPSLILPPEGLLCGEVEFSDGKRYSFQWEVGAEWVSTTRKVTRRIKRPPYQIEYDLRVELGKKRRQAMLKALNEYLLH